MNMEAQKDLVEKKVEKSLQKCLIKEIFFVTSFCIPAQVSLFLKQVTEKTQKPFLDLSYHILLAHLRIFLFLFTIRLFEKKKNLCILLLLL